MVFRNKKIIAVGGGKGGVGKSFLVSNLATALAQEDRMVTMVDTNVGSSNLHTFLGVSFPEKTLKDFIYDKYANLHSILINNPHSSAQLISGASEVLGLTTPTYNQKQRLFRGLKALNCDTLFLDLPTGSSQEILDTFMLSTVGLIVMEPVSTTMESDFLFLKSVVLRIFIRVFKKDKEILQMIDEAFNPKYRQKPSTVEEIVARVAKLDREKTETLLEELNNLELGVVLNNCRSDLDEEVVEPYQKLVKKYLSIDLDYWGKISYGDEVIQSIEKRIPLVLQKPVCPTSKDLIQIAEKVK